MKTTAETQSHRFVVVYRNEAREIENAAEIWRGWIERIPYPRQRESDQQVEDRLGFQTLEELPLLITRLMERSPPPERKPSHDR